MSDLVAVAIINGGFGILVLILGVRLNRKVNTVRADARASRDQLVNGHSTNLREEADDRHDENGRKLDDILDEIKSLRTSVGRLWRRSDRHTDQIHDLELTQPAEQRRKQ